MSSKSFLKLKYLNMYRDSKLININNVKNEDDKMSMSV